MASETVRAVKLAALPTTPDEATRSASLIVATEAAIAGMVLQCRDGAVVFPSGPVPLLLDHEAKVVAIAGRLQRFELNGGELRALAVVADGPASEAAWPLVRSGAVGVSVRAEILESTPGGLGQPEIATRWRIREASLTPLPADPACVVRSAVANHQSQGDQTMTAQIQPEAAAAPTAAEVRKAREVQRQLDKLLTVVPAEHHEQIRQLAERDGFAAARDAGLDLAAAEQGKTPCHARSYDPSREVSDGLERRRMSVWSRPSYGSHQGQSELQRAVDAFYEGKAAEPLGITLRRLGFQGRTHADVVRGALATSDLPLHLEAAGNRQAMAAFAQAPQGVRVAAIVQQLSDYRPKSTLDIGLVGTASEVKQGGEVTFRPIDESGTTYQPKRYALAVSVTPESQVNDDLEGLPRVMGEMPLAMLESEARMLAGLLEGHAQGATAPDGKRLFDASHKNTVASGPLDLSKLGDGVALLRTQTSVGGRHVFQTPGILLCAPAAEMTLLQLVSDNIAAAEAANFNPWRNLQVEVDPLLSGQFVYLLADGARKPLELGRLTPAPVITSEVEFSTGFFRSKCEHSFGAVVIDHRPIVRLTVAGS